MREGFLQGNWVRVRVCRLGVLKEDADGDVRVLGMSVWRLGIRLIDVVDGMFLEDIFLLLFICPGVGVELLMPQGFGYIYWKFFDGGGYDIHDLGTSLGSGAVSAIFTHELKCHLHMTVAN